MQIEAYRRIPERLPAEKNGACCMSYRGTNCGIIATVCSVSLGIHGMESFQTPGDFHFKLQEKPATVIRSSFVQVTNWTEIPCSTNCLRMTRVDSNQSGLECKTVWNTRFPAIIDNMTAESSIPQPKAWGKKLYNLVGCVLLPGSMQVDRMAVWMGEVLCNPASNVAFRPSDFDEIPQ